MQKYDVIEKGIKENDIELLREAIGSIIYTCRDFSDGEFDELVKYVEEKGIKLKDDTIIGEPLISNKKDEFLEEDFVRAIFNLKNNFCDARITDVKKIGKALYGSENKPNAQKNQKVQQHSGTSPNRKSRQQKKESKKEICPAAKWVILAVILGIVWFVKKVL